MARTAVLFFLVTLNFPSSLHFHLVSLQPNLYPTVGLQTPGEIVDANFGQQPFVYDIEEVMKVHCITNMFRAFIKNFSKKQCLKMGPFGGLWVFLGTTGVHVRVHNVD